jgi:hypothetical protein
MNADDVFPFCFTSTVEFNTDMTTLMKEMENYKPDPRYTLQPSEYKPAASIKIFPDDMFKTKYEMLDNYQRRYVKKLETFMKLYKAHKNASSDKERDGYKTLLEACADDLEMLEKNIMNNLAQCKHELKYFMSKVDEKHKS